MICRLISTLAAAFIACGCRTTPPSIVYHVQELGVIKDVLPMVVQPDLGKWRQLKAEMTEAEVAALLGQPYRKDPRPPDDITPDVINLYGWYYGEITFKSFSTQGAFQYTVGFHEGQVREINDPWNGQFSSTRMTSTSPSRGWAPTPVAGGSGA